MTTTDSEIETKLNHACDRFFERDRELLELDTSERSMTHKLAEYLQQEFPHWNVDCEYNRGGHDPKLLRWDQCDHSNEESGRVSPDIVIHQRGTCNNLVVIEAKKSNGRNDGHDCCKLKAFRSSLKYKHCYLLTFSVGNDAGAALTFTRFPE